MRIVHIITDLIVGGAQVMLRDLLRHTQHAGFETEVISLADGGAMGEQIERLGVPVRSIEMRQRGDAMRLQGVRELVGEVRRFRPHVVQTWLYHADLVGGIAARLAGVRNIVWGLHISHLDARSIKRTTLWTVRACARLSHWLPSKIVCCAETAAQLHIAAGYAAEKIIVIPNGFDTDCFKPDEAARSRSRSDLGVSNETPLIGLCGRFHPQKDHRNFVRAAALLSRRMPDARFVLCGEGSDWHNLPLVEWIDDANLRERFFLLGRRGGMQKLYPAFDILSLSSSYGEAFPMVIGEAMACGVPCVVTDVGDSKLMVGDAGRAVPVENPQALAEAWEDVLKMPCAARMSLGVAARERITDNYSIDRIAARYESLYKSFGV